MNDQLSLEREFGPAVRRLSPGQRAALAEHRRRRPRDDADWQERYRWWLRLIDLRRAAGESMPWDDRPENESNYLRRRLPRENLASLGEVETKVLPAPNG